MLMMSMSLLLVMVPMVVAIGCVWGSLVRMECFAGGATDVDDDAATGVYFFKFDLYLQYLVNEYRAKQYTQNDT